MNDKIQCICGATYPDYMIYNVCAQCSRNLQTASPVNDNQVSKLKKELAVKESYIKELEAELLLKNSSIDRFNI